MLMYVKAHISPNKALQKNIKSNSTNKDVSKFIQWHTQREENVPIFQEAQVYGDVPQIPDVLKNRAVPHLITAPGILARNNKVHI